MVKFDLCVNKVPGGNGGGEDQVKGYHVHKLFTTTFLFLGDEE